MKVALDCGISWYQSRRTPEITIYSYLGILRKFFSNDSLKVSNRNKAHKGRLLATSATWMRTTLDGGKQQLACITRGKFEPNSLPWHSQNVQNHCWCDKSCRNKCWGLKKTRKLRHDFHVKIERTDKCMQTRFYDSVTIWKPKVAHSI